LGVKKQTGRRTDRAREKGKLPATMDPEARKKFWRKRRGPEQGGRQRTVPVGGEKRGKKKIGRTNKGGGGGRKGK